ncbi:MAG: 5-formyltetrahydrofolate cyclo-ligase [Geminicoccaceae bacterium]
MRLALPVVIERAKPVAFRAWWPGMRMRPGIWDIPVPDEGDWTCPEALLVPLLGFDPQGYRLGTAASRWSSPSCRCATRRTGWREWLRSCVT